MTGQPAALAAALRRHAHQIDHDTAKTSDAGVRDDAAADADALRRRADEAERS